LIDPHVTRIHSVITIVRDGTDREGFSIVGEGTGIPKLIAVRLPDDVLADLLPTAGVNVTSPTSREKTLMYPGG
jgi:hypothetical protein